MDAQYPLIHDWPWLLPWRKFVTDLPSAELERGYIANVLNGLAERVGGKIRHRFVFSDEVIGAMEYEHRVAQGVIPTRDCWHDWYNGLAWLRFPASKSLINQLHVKESIQVDSGNGRSEKRNALTLLDEAGAVLLYEHPQTESALREFDWQALLVEGRESWGQHCRLELFGHGLLESLHQPYKGLCAKVICVQVNSLQELASSCLDEVLVARIAAINSTLQMNPLPVMGIPGWFGANTSADFYNDPRVFRKKPTRRQ